MKEDEAQLCSLHSGQTRESARAGRCTATTVEGAPCTNAAMYDSDPPLCSTHAGVSGFEEGHFTAWKHGYYSPRLFPWDIEYIEETKARLARGEVRLDLEMALCRLAMGRLLEATNEFREMPAERLAEAAGALFRGVKVVSQILEAREAVGEMERERQALDGWAEGLVWILEEE